MGGLGGDIRGFKNSRYSQQRIREDSYITVCVCVSNVTGQVIFSENQCDTVHLFTSSRSISAVIPKPTAASASVV